MMNQLDSLAWHIMDAMADDWESIEQIEPHVVKFHGQEPREAIVHRISRLYDDGLIEAMDSDGNATASRPDDMTQAWFRMTETGRSLWDSEAQKYPDD